VTALRVRWAGALCLALLSACAFDEAGFPHFYRVEHNPPLPPYPRKVSTAVCADAVLDQQMRPLAADPRTTRPMEIIRGCGSEWLVVPCTDPSHGQPGSFLESLDGGRSTFCRPVASAALSDAARVARESLGCEQPTVQFEEAPEAVARGCGGAWSVRSCRTGRGQPLPGDEALSSAIEGVEKTFRGYTFVPFDGGTPTACRSPFDP
jgi:hypothetical protein